MSFLLDAMTALGIWYTPRQVLALGYGAGKTQTYALVAANPPFGGEIMATDELDWQRAEKHLETVERNYNDLIGMPGVNPYGASVSLAINYAPGAEWEPCDECKGAGGYWECGSLPHPATASESE